MGGGGVVERRCHRLANVCCGSNGFRATNPEASSAAGVTTAAATTHRQLYDVTPAARVK